MFRILKVAMVALAAGVVLRCRCLGGTAVDLVEKVIVSITISWALK
jgi:hypothetical protein